MKNRNLFLAILLSVIFFSCSKDDDKDILRGELTTTIVEGQIINHLTQQPIGGIEVEYWEKIWVDPGFLSEDDSESIRRKIYTDEDGKFSIHYDSDYAYWNYIKVQFFEIGNEITYRSELNIVNGVEKPFWAGDEYDKGKEYYLLIELTPK